MSEAFEELRDLYQEVILDHGRHPRNFRRLDGALHAKGDNPMCGDRVEVWLKLGAGERIEDASFQGRGCAISIASASLMTEVLRGKTRDQARRLAEAFRTLARTGACPVCGEVHEEDIERLQPLAGVAEYPSRVKCATLAWHAMEAALKGEGSATTE
ncbi:Fe-S cluster assembly sulfur transfer protein SufU [Elioraea sp.]|uniref:Fe-S cluster assembly sulfur transfer protein SufU n=1 Tax=Elioraea sp. TaxID=2185103 RepID=UPI0021DE1DAA|nr:SUF system NifU family Fe-S cluster assembly protein [Elioraea sp.]GIX11974.1 MAG: iron-sulfur cluster assembly scaffold protein [Elioraea sp.]